MKKAKLFSPSVIPSCFFSISCFFIAYLSIIHGSLTKSYSFFFLAGRSDRKNPKLLGLGEEVGKKTSGEEAVKNYYALKGRSSTLNT